MPDLTAAPLFRRLLHNETGIAATEYSLIAMLIAVAAASAIGTLGEEVNAHYAGIDEAVQDANTR